MPVNLNNRGLSVDTTCQACGLEGESTNHSLFLCPVSRQVWALSYFPFPADGFQNGSVFSNMFHLLENKDNKDWPPLLRKSFPWIIWRIWKNRNALIFDGISFSALDSVNKIREDINEWFEAQVVENTLESPYIPALGVSHGAGIGPLCAWKKPPEQWLKCNIGSSWSRRNQNCGGAWILRDAEGMVILHSRRAFGRILNKEDAMLRVVLWTLESMASHRVDNVIFAFQDKALVGAVNRPSAWPSFRAQSLALKSFLMPFLVWKFEVEVAAANRGANLVAQSVTGDLRGQSYVASGHPVWLSRVFEDERGLNSV